MPLGNAAHASTPTELPFAAALRAVLAIHVVATAGEAYSQAADILNAEYDRHEPYLTPDEIALLLRVNDTLEDARGRVQVTECDHAPG